MYYLIFYGVYIFLAYIFVIGTLNYSNHHFGKGIKPFSGPGSEFPVCVVSDVQITNYFFCSKLTFRVNADTFVKQWYFGSVWLDEPGVDTNFIYDDYDQPIFFA